MLLAKPKQGLTLRDPRTRTIVPAEGVLVPDHDPFWRQLERFGDVDLIEPPPEPAQLEHEVAALPAPEPHA